MKKVRRTFDRASKTWGKRGDDPEKFKQARNTYRRTLKKIKKKYWSQFLLNDEDNKTEPQVKSDRC